MHRIEERLYIHRCEQAVSKIIEEQQLLKYISKDHDVSLAKVWTNKYEGKVGKVGRKAWYRGGERGGEGGDKKKYHA